VVERLGQLAQRHVRLGGDQPAQLFQVLLVEPGVVRPLGLKRFQRAGLASALDQPADP
jgi:hypothetical protein